MDKGESERERDRERERERERGGEGEGKRGSLAFWPGLIEKLVFNLNGTFLVK